MSRRPTIADIARKAGVSTATVDRVLNARKPVSSDTVRQVYDAAEELNYFAKPLLKRRLAEYSPRREFAFVLLGRSSYHERLAEALASATRERADIDGSAQVHVIEEFNIEAIVGRLREVEAAVDAAGLVAFIDHPVIADEIRRMREAGTPVVSIRSSLVHAPAAGHVGIAGRRAGRTAGWGMKRCAHKSGAVEILIDGLHIDGYHDVELEDRESGFTSYIRQHAPNLHISRTYSYQSDEEAYRITEQIIRENSGTVGYYIVGRGNKGPISAIRANLSPGEVAVVCHELTATTRGALVDGYVDLVIDTPVRKLAEAAVDVLCKVVQAPHDDPAINIIPFDLYTSENV